ncbi:transposase [Rahnella sp. CJA17(1/100)]|uniref:IS66-like element accessory protein TnpA n=1 Tax=Rahnella sp. CJA17(1/100) TaxID=2508951 RepID=UPI00106FF841|nr:transposase [Rahnella sp. CJA17(1/100)]
MESQSWRKEPRKNYSNDFKLRMVELASRPGACVAQIARENGVNDNVIFKWLRLWQNEGRISRRLPATVESSPSPTMLPVEVIPDPTPSAGMNTEPGQLSALNASSCCVEFRHGKMTLENPSPELLAVLLRELTGRSQ